MQELPLHKPPTLPQRLMQVILLGLRRVMPKRKPQRDVPHPPDVELEGALREHFLFLFNDCGARIVRSQAGTVIIECGSFGLKAIRDRDSLVFFIGPTAHPHGWDNADIAIAAATGEAPLDVRTSLTQLAVALESRVAALQSAFAPEHISRTDEAIANLRLEQMKVAGVRSR